MAKTRRDNDSLNVTKPPSLSTNEPIAEEPEESQSTKKSRRSVLKSDSKPVYVAADSKQPGQSVVEVADKTEHVISSPKDSRRKSSRRSVSITEPPKSTPESSRTTRKSIAFPECIQENMANRLREEASRPSASPVKSSRRQSTRRSLSITETKIATPENSRKRRSVAMASSIIPEVQSTEVDMPVSSSPKCNQRRSSRRSLSITDSAVSTPQSLRKSRRSIAIVPVTIQETEPEENEAVQTPMEDLVTSNPEKATSGVMGLESLETDALPTCSHDSPLNTSNSSDDVFMLADKENIQPRASTKTPKNIRNKSFGGFR